MWQPIDTAPKDGTPVIIGSQAGVGEAWCSPSDLKWRWPDGELVLMTPTDWMPLPPIPTQEHTIPDHSEGPGNG